jgi:hypothetical protein
MKNLILVSAFVAMGLTMSVMSPIHRALAAEGCESATDLGCNMAASANYATTPTQHEVATQVQRRHANDFPLAIQSGRELSTPPNSCDDLSGMGSNSSGVPASLYGRC